MNHLQEAKNNIIAATMKDSKGKTFSYGEKKTAGATAHALIAIAEQLERPTNNEIAWSEYSLFDSYKDEWHTEHDTMAGFPYSDFYEFLGRDK